MRKTEMTLGLIASMQVVLAVLSLLGVTEYLPGTLARAAYSGYTGRECAGRVGALIVLKCHVAGSVLMLVAAVTAWCWGSVAVNPGTVPHIMAIVLAMVPVKPISRPGRRAK